MKDRATLIADIASDLQGIRLPPARATDLAAEVSRLNDAVRAATGQLSFDDDPAAYAALLAKASSS
ncbi:hypothetical protein [Reyranella sp. CPCC 100927]|uniref:hypothetical protein n=1 Tax=Reyranella sp. CPCC 100927 TaxID=2599616 RepID=UPI0021044E7D|nr:hypothetical protein [Reyranella sp. CPCC 100927]